MNLTLHVHDVNKNTFKSYWVLFTQLCRFGLRKQNISWRLFNSTNQLAEKKTKENKFILSQSSHIYRNQPLIKFKTTPALRASVDIRQMLKTTQHSRVIRVVTSLPLIERFIVIDPSIFGSRFARWGEMIGQIRRLRRETSGMQTTRQAKVQQQQERTTNDTRTKTLRFPDRNST